MYANVFFQDICISLYLCIPVYLLCFSVGKAKEPWYFFVLSVVTVTCLDVFVNNVPSVAQKGQRAIPNNIHVLHVSCDPQL